MNSKRNGRQHRDTTVSLHPLSFEQAITALANTPKHEGSEAEGFGK